MHLYCIQVLPPGPLYQRRHCAIVKIEKAVTVEPPYAGRTRRHADAAFECSRNVHMYQFLSAHFKTSAETDEHYRGGHANI